MNFSLRKGIFSIIIFFAFLFSLRLIYGFYYPTTYRSSDFSLFSSLVENVKFDRKNYASAKFKGNMNSGLGVDQKYEKIGTLKAASQDFEKDDLRLRSIIASFGGMIQFEQTSGLEDHRQLNLGIGVLPEKFDSFLAEARQVGRLLGIQIDKKDKTNEYQELKAKRSSLEKARDSLEKLKGASVTGARVDELINLENRILSIEQEIQVLGVNLGEFDEKNEFCTVKFFLIEEGRKIPGIALVQRVKVAFEWTAKYGFVCTGFIAFCLVIISSGLYIFARLSTIFVPVTPKT
ncbi:MAG: DUF4349 domain-containing protein [Candidatus Ozemobacteraceae bacterium]